jgi:1-acyl-sn-glycerol-3-phosphate acyltransferase
MSKISDYPLSFSIVRNYVVFTFKRYYSEYIVLGRENVPTDCPLIFAPNHINALMDAIAIHSIAPYKVPVIFLARADIFKNKKSAQLLKSAKILPAFRMRDGMENLSKNNEVFEQCVEILDQNKILGIMPEGNQGEQRKLRPLVKGIFRIAFAAQQKYDSQSKVKIIPVGIDYGDLVKYGKHIIINIGKPIEMSEYIQLYNENPVTTTNEIRDRLRLELNSLSLDLATENYYECFRTITGVANTYFVKKLQLVDNTVFRFVARQEIAKRLTILERTEPEKIEKLDVLAKNYIGLLEKTNLRNWVFEQYPFKTESIITEGLLLLLTFPFFVYGFICNFLPFFIPVYIRKFVIKAQYEGFFSSLQFGIGIFLFPFFYLMQTILFYNLTDTYWWLSLLFFITQYPFGKLAVKWNGIAKKFMAKIRFKRLKHKKSFELIQAQNIRELIISMIS